MDEQEEKCPTCKREVPLRIAWDCCADENPTEVCDGLLKPVLEGAKTPAQFADDVLKLVKKDTNVETVKGVKQFIEEEKIV